MRLIRFRHANEIHTGVLSARGVVPVAEINARRGTNVADDLLEIIRRNAVSEIAAIDGLPAIPLGEVTPLIPYDAPPKIWCIGLNYRSHADDIQAVESLEVITEHNDAIWSRDFVRNMRTRPGELVRYHSDFMTLEPGDLISTGCPKGARIRAGDRVRARIDGVSVLAATVRQGAREGKN